MVDFEKEGKETMGNIVSFAKNLFFSPKQSIKELGSISNFSTIATTQTILFSFLIPITYLIAWVIIGVGSGYSVRLRLSFLMWINSAVLIMFYNLILTFLAAKTIYFFRNSIGFNGSKEKANQIAVLSACAYFFITSILILLSFIHIKLVGVLRWVSPVVAAGMVFYVLFVGFNQNYETDESKKNQFAGVIAGIFIVLGIGINLLAYEFLGLALALGSFGKY